MIHFIRPLFVAFALMLPLTATAQEILPANVTAIKPSELVSRIETSTKPFALLVFASWCPYCKKQIDALSQLLPEQRAALPSILIVSIDSQPEAFSRFMLSHPGLPFESRLYQGENSLETLLHNYASEFNGAIPYIAVFQNKKIIKQFNGLVDPAMLSTAPWLGQPVDKF